MTRFGIMCAGSSHHQVVSSRDINLNRYTGRRKRWSRPGDSHSSGSCDAVLLLLLKREDVKEERKRSEELV